MDNREKILKIALRLFSLKGYDSVGVQQIVEESGVTKPTLYHYFKSKSGLLQALLEEYSGRMERAVREEAVYNHDIVNNLYKIGAVFFRFAREYPDFYRLRMALLFSPPENEANGIVKKFSEKLVNLLEDLFRKASIDHGNMAGRHKIYAATFAGMLDTYCTLHLNNYLELEDKLVYQAVHQFMHGIFS